MGSLGCNCTKDSVEQQADMRIDKEKKEDYNRNPKTVKGGVTERTDSVFNTVIFLLPLF